MSTTQVVRKPTSICFLLISAKVTEVTELCPFHNTITYCHELHNVIIDHKSSRELSNLSAGFNSQQYVLFPARTPSLDELKAKIIEGGPLPPVTQGPPQPGTQPPPVTEPPPPSM